MSKLSKETAESVSQARHQFLAADRHMDRAKSAQDTEAVEELVRARYAYQGELDKAERELGLTEGG